MSRILLALTPDAARVRAAVPLVAAWRSHGHDVVVTTGRRHAAALAAAGAVVVPTRRALTVRDPWAVAAQELPSVERAVARHRPDVVVADDGSVAGLLAAVRHAVPSVLLQTGPLPLSSRDTAPFGTGHLPPRSGFGGLRYARTGRALRRAERPRTAEAARLLDGLGVAVPDGPLGDWAASLAGRVVQTWLPGLEYPRGDLPAHVETVGPLLDAAPRVPSRRSARPVVAVSAGPGATEPEPLLWPALDGLAASGAVVVLVTGAMDADDVLPADPPAHVHAVPTLRAALPHADVLVCAGDVSEVQQALVAGVPVVVAGARGVAAEVGARVAWSGAGAVVAVDASGAATSRAVERAVRRVLADDAATERAAEVAAAAREADAVARLVALVEELAPRAVLPVAVAA